MPTEQETKTYTEEEMQAELNRTRFLERFQAWYTVSMQRSIQNRDPQEWQQAAIGVMQIILAPAAKPEDAAQQKLAETEEEKE